MRQGIRVYCSVCRQQKKPHGRSGAMNGPQYCDTECPGYWEEPKPGCLWPGETSQDFGYAHCDYATEEI